MKNTLILFSLICLLGSSCNTSTDSKSEGKETPAPAELPVEVVTIDQEGYKLPIAIPKEYLADSELSITFNGASGDLEVACGEDYQLIISDIPGDTEALLKRLETDLVFKFEVVEQKNQGLLYKQFLPNNERTFWHFYVVVDHEGAQFVIKDGPLSELNEYHSRKIFEALLHATEHEAK